MNTNEMCVKNKRLKILFLPGWYPTEENPVAGVFTKEHAKAVSLYNEVVVLYGEGCDKNVKKIWQISSDRMEDGIRTIKVRYKKSPIPKTTYFIYLWSIKEVFKKLWKEGWKPDIIHAHVYTAGIPAVILGKKHKIPIVITEHSSAFPRHLLSSIEILKARFSFNKANIYLPVSKNLQEHIASYGIKNKFEIVPNAINMKDFYPPGSEQNGQDSSKKILTVAMLNPVKGIPYLLQALARLKQKRQDFLLDIVGDGPNSKEYEALTIKLGLEKIVKFHGSKTKQEVAENMRNCHFFVLPSLWETFSCVLIEAMASGLPIIASQIGGIPELINEKRGILVPPKDVNALTRAIDYMLDHYQEYSPKEISRYATENFSYEQVGKQLNNIYQSL